jgi:HAD superfamily hydrolase (TIGR01509 family)
MTRPVAFDLDGTLVDSLSITFEGWNAIFARRGLAELSPDEIMAYFGPGEREIFARVLGPGEADSAYAEHVEFLAANLARAPLHEGVAELLGRLRDEGVPLAVVTGRSWPTTERLLAHHGLLPRFVTVIAHDHVGRAKPAPDGLELAAKRLGVAPSRLYYVGDTSADIGAARAAGALAVAATWDRYARREKLAAAGPDAWATRPDDVWRLWESERNGTRRSPE